MFNTYQLILLAVFAFMTLVGIIIMFVDKQKAKHNKWRIKEATLFAVAILFGGIGTTIGMYTFRHKNKHWYFALFFPLFAIIDIGVLIYGLNFLANI